mgnify:CR=1 FL=1
MLRNKKISIVIPIYNCQETIYNLVENIIKELNDKFKLEIVLINDCSTDLSEKECIRAFNNFPGKIKFYSLGKNVGEHSAVMAGLNNTSAYAWWQLDLSSSYNSRSWTAPSDGETLIAPLDSVYCQQEGAVDTGMGTCLFAEDAPLDFRSNQRGMEGAADENQDSKISNGELITYIQNNVSKVAFSQNREQDPMLAGDPDKVLMSYR